MKHMKKLVTLLLALIMALALVVPASAYTVDNKTDHAYKAYQIFSGTQSTESKPALGDVKWGNGIESAKFLTALKADTRFGTGDKNIFAACNTAADVAAIMAKEQDKSAVAKAFANVAAQYLTNTAVDIAAKKTSDVVLNPGYYLLVDVTTPGKGDAMNSALLQVTGKGNIIIEQKYDAPSVGKSVKDTDGAWGEAADWCIGSNVPFQLIGKLPSNYADYETYKYVFHDTLGTGLQYNGDVKVYVRNGEKDTELTSGFTVAPDKAATAGGGSLTITFDNLKTITSITSSSSIVVKYTAKLLNTAVIGQPGNPNEVYLEYSSNPNFSGTGTPPTSETPKDRVLVFTYQLDINKVTGWADTQGKGSTLITNANGLAQVIGLDAGTYELYETKAPGGYNKLKDPIKIVITATLDKTEDNPALTALTIKVDDIAAKAGDVTKGTVSTTVTNNSGATLPETGGVGTTLFYIIGGVLMVGAAVLLVTRKRMNNTK